MALSKDWPEITDNQVETIVKKIDMDGDGLISKQEMLKSAISMEYARGTIKKIEEVAG